MRTGRGILHGIFNWGSHRSTFKHYSYHGERAQDTSKGDRWLVNIDLWPGSTAWSVEEGKPDQLGEFARRPSSRCVEACSILRCPLRRGGDDQFLYNKKHIWDKEIFDRWARK